MKTYAEAQTTLGNRASRKLANHTYLQRRDIVYNAETCPGRPCGTECDHKSPNGSIAVKLHDTDILTFYPNNRVVYNSGNWRTTTTKERMNRFGPMCVTSERGVWYLAEDWRNKATVHVYRDGITVQGSRVYHAAPKTAIAADARTRRAVAQYAADFMRELTAGKVPLPSGGDCWFCCMVVSSPEKDKGKSLGEASHDVDHIRSHVSKAERYYVPSLAFNAQKQFANSPVCHDLLLAYMMPADHPQADRREQVIRMEGRFGAAQLQKAIRRYCLRQMGMSA